MNREFDVNDDYSDYEGAQYSELFRRQRELPFGSKLQNHALNNRLNEEFHGRFPQQNLQPILRDLDTSRYWFNENLLTAEINGEEHNLSRAIIDIIDSYVEAKQGAFRTFIADVENLQRISRDNPTEGLRFINRLLRPNVDARIFEIVSYAILRSHFHEQAIYWGWTLESIQRESLTLYKTGRTNANDGGIDFVMKPLGRFFQVTESTDFGKYFLDIDKVLRYPITFVIKSEQSISELTFAIQSKAEEIYPVRAIVDKYMSAVEELINIPRLTDILHALSEDGRIVEVVDEILLYSKVEFHFSGQN